MINAVSSAKSTAPNTVLSSSSTSSTTMSSVLGSSSTKVYDKRDLNKDGTVTDSERTRYDMAHPQEKQKPAEKASTFQSALTYNPQAKNAVKSSGGTLDFYK